MLVLAGARDQGVTLGHCPGGALGHRQFKISPLSLGASNRPRRNNLTSVVGHGGDWVNGVEDYLCEGRWCYEYARKGQDRRGPPPRAMPGVFWLVE